LTCPIKCIECNVTGRRFLFSDGYPRHCTCPICMCVCNRTYFIEDVPKLLLMYRKVPVQVQSSQSSKQSKPLDWLTKSVAQGFQAATDSTASQNVSYSSSNNNNIEMNENFDDAIYSSIAESMSKNAAMMDQQQRQFLRDNLPKPNNNIVTPSGATCSTRSAMSANHHASNNTMSGVSTIII